MKLWYGMICVNMYHTSYNIFVYCISCHIILYHTIEFISGWWFQPLWKIWKSVGMIIPNIWKKNGPNHQPDIYTLASLPLRHQSSGPRADVLLAARLGSYCDPHNGRGTVPAAAKPCQWGTCQKQQQWSPVWEYEGPALSQISNKYEDSNHLQLAKKKACLKERT